MFPEALMLHYMDDLDSKMEAMRAQFERESETDSPWTSYNSSLARPLLNTQKFLAKPEPEAEAEAPVPVDDKSFDEKTEVAAVAVAATVEAASVSNKSLADLQSHFAAKKISTDGK
jgi:3'-5' exoribonuclease